MRRLIPLFLVLCLATTASAQSLPVLRSTGGDAPLDPAQSSSSAQRVTWAAAGAVLGAFLGFFASQVVRGDWDDVDDPIDRTAWAAGGAAVGLAVGFAAGPSWAGRGSITPAPALPDGREVLLPDEIAALGSGARNALELIRLLRPEWLHDRGTQILCDPDDTDCPEGRDQVRVYVDEAAVGVIDDLGSIPVDVVAWARRLDAHTATARFGAGNTHGAIILSTRPLPER